MADGPAPSERPLARVEGPATADHLRHRLHVVHARDALDQLDILSREHTALGRFESRIALRQVDSDRLRPAIAQQVGARRLDARQVVERVVLPRKRIPLGLRHALHNRDGIRPNLFEHFGVAGLELFGGKVGLVVLRRRGCRHQQHECQSRNLHRCSSRQSATGVDFSLRATGGMLPRMTASPRAPRRRI